MARARNLKPGLYKNEDLAECSVWARYIFPGLWCIADREGRLEDRPKRIKGELLPFDSEDVEPLLAELEAAKFILRYEVDGVRYIQILAFAKHQNPHFRESPSVIPPPPGLGLDADAKGGEAAPLGEPDDGDPPGQPEADAGLKVAEAPGKPGAEGGLKGGEAGGWNAGQAGGLKGGPATLNPSSLIPDKENTPLPPKGGEARTRKPPRTPEEETADLTMFEHHFWPKYPKKADKPAAFRAWRKLRVTPELLAKMLAGLELWKRHHLWTKDGGQFRHNASTWLNRRLWEDEEVCGTALAAGVGPVPEWCTRAGFECVAEAHNRMCWEHNAHLFRDGRRLPAEEVTT